MAQTRRPVVEGWFTEQGDGSAGGAAGSGFRLLGTRCSARGSVFFPPVGGLCRNPLRGGGPGDGRPVAARADLVVHGLPVPAPGTVCERTGRALGAGPGDRGGTGGRADGGAGPAAPGVTVADPAVGMAVEVVPGILYVDDEYDGSPHGAGTATVRTTWNWRPTGVTE